MKILDELSRDELVKKFGGHRDFKYFSRPRKHCYLVALTKEEYENLGMNSSPNNPFPEKGQFPKVKDSLAQFIENPDFLNETHSERGISGTTVKRYLEKLKNGEELKDCFITDDVVLNSYYICEGMHRLTAYGLFNKLGIKDYEVKVYYLTDKD